MKTSIILLLTLLLLSFATATQLETTTQDGDCDGDDSHDHIPEIFHHDDTCGEIHTDQYFNGYEDCQSISLNCDTRSYYAEECGEHSWER